MNLSSMKTAVTSSVGLKMLAVKAQSPNILFAAGIVGFAGTVVLASKATLKLNEVLDDSLSQQELASTIHEDRPSIYTEADREKDIKIIKMQTGLRIAKLYGPALIVGGLSVAALTGSHKILTDRNAAIAAAYTALDRAFQKYRKRVIEAEGKEKDQEYRHGVIEREVLIETDDQGPQVVRQKSYDPSDLSAYSFEFSKHTTMAWQPGPGYNQTFLLAQQKFANERLIARGWLTLNDVLDALGLEKTQAGMVVGWTVNGDGDGFIDFGIFDNDNPTMTEFRRGDDNVVLLDFNVDGYIVDKAFLKESK